MLASLGTLSVEVEDGTIELSSVLISPIVVGPEVELDSSTVAVDVSNAVLSTGNPVLVVLGSIAPVVEMSTACSPSVALEVAVEEGTVPAVTSSGDPGVSLPPVVKVLFVVASTSVVLFVSSLVVVVSGSSASGTVVFVASVVGSVSSPSGIRLPVVDSTTLLSVSSASGIVTDATVALLDVFEVLIATVSVLVFSRAVEEETGVLSSVSAVECSKVEVSPAVDNVSLVVVASSLTVPSPGSAVVFSSSVSGILAVVLAAPSDTHCGVVVSGVVVRWSIESKPVSVVFFVGSAASVVIIALVSSFSVTLDVTLALGDTLWPVSLWITVDVTGAGVVVLPDWCVVFETEAGAVVGGSGPIEIF